MNKMIFFMYSYVVIIMIVTQIHAMENIEILTPEVRKQVCIAQISYFFKLSIPEYFVNTTPEFERFLDARTCAQKAIFDLKDSGDNYITDSIQYVYGKNYYLYFKNKVEANGIPESSVFCYNYETYYPPPEGTELSNFVSKQLANIKKEQNQILCINQMEKTKYLGKTNKEAVQHAFYTVAGHELIKLFYAFQYTDLISKRVTVLAEDPHLWCHKKVYQNIPKRASAGSSRNSTVIDVE